MGVRMGWRSHMPSPGRPVFLGFRLQEARPALRQGAVWGYRCGGGIPPIPDPDIAKIALECQRLDQPSTLQTPSVIFALAKLNQKPQFCEPGYVMLLVCHDG